MSEVHNTNANDLGHEPIEISARSVSIGMAALLGVMFASLLLVGGLMLGLSYFWGGRATVGVPPAMALPESQRETLRELREMENKLLTEYAWIDAQAGVARIPIERAMKILAERWPKTPETSDESRSENE